MSRCCRARSCSMQSIWIPYYVLTGHSRSKVPRLLDAGAAKPSVRIGNDTFPVEFYFELLCSCVPTNCSSHGNAVSKARTSISRSLIKSYGWKFAVGTITISAPFIATVRTASGIPHRNISIYPLNTVKTKQVRFSCFFSNGILCFSKRCDFLYTPRTRPFLSIAQQNSQFHHHSISLEIPQSNVFTSLAIWHKT